MRFTRLIPILILLALTVHCTSSGMKPEEEEDNGDDSTGYETIVNELYTKNVYLESIIEWNPGTVGAGRINRSGITDSEANPIQNNRAFGPPRGLGSTSSNNDYICLGINGSAAFKFQTGHFIYDGTGDDFVTFASTFAWGRECDGLCNELAHVEVSEDGSTWYKPDDATWDVNPAPNENNSGYLYSNVAGLHGNNPTFANYLENRPSEEIVNDGGTLKWQDSGRTVPKDFEASNPDVGGVRFDLSDFVAVGDGSPWPVEGKMRYIRFTDDSSILDGQDYLKEWCYGANIQAAMGINTQAE